MTDAVLYLNDRARLALQNLQERFIFRKLGICYDYATTPEDFPRKTLPDARDAREGRPNRSGLGTGRIYTITYKVTDSCGNTAYQSVTVTVPKSQGKNK